MREMRNFFANGHDFSLIYIVSPKSFGEGAEQSIHSGGNKPG